MSEITLYTRNECHLCDEAGALVERVAPEVALHKVDIESDLKLIRRYGVRVPVLFRSDNQAELDWPFNTAALQEFLDA